MLQFLCDQLLFYSFVLFADFQVWLLALGAASWLWGSWLIPFFIQQALRSTIQFEFGSARLDLGLRLPQVSLASSVSRLSWPSAGSRTRKLFPVQARLAPAQSLRRHGVPWSQSQLWSLVRRYVLVLVLELEIKFIKRFVQFLSSSYQKSVQNIMIDGWEFVY